MLLNFDLIVRHLKSHNHYLTEPKKYKYNGLIKILPIILIFYTFLKAHANICLSFFKKIYWTMKLKLKFPNCLSCPFCTLAPLLMVYLAEFQNALIVKRNPIIFPWQIILFYYSSFITKVVFADNDHIFLILIYFYYF